VHGGHAEFGCWREVRGYPINQHASAEGWPSFSLSGRSVSLVQLVASVRVVGLDAPRVGDDPTRMPPARARTAAWMIPWVQLP
jgi:hypothetical protein